MAELPLEELISAYFDGELSADERARAEQVLLDDPQARRLLDQFRRLRGHVRQLPRHTLPGDFCQQVLRGAERQMLAQAATPAGAKSTRTDAASAGYSAGQPWSERIRRPLIYSMLAASVALVLMAVSPERSANTGAVAMKTPASGAETAVEEQHSADDYSTSSRLAPPAPSISAPGMATPSGEVAAAADAPLPTAAPGSPAAPAASAETLERSGSMLSLSKGGAAGGMGADGGMGAFGARYADGAGLAASQFELNEQGLLVVQCGVAPEALKNQSFQKVLAKQQVQWNYASVEDQQTLGVSGGLPEGRLGKQVAGDDASVKLLYVEATPEQMERTLAELSSQPQNFPTVAVDPVANTGRQLRWQNQYSRRGQLENYYSQSGQADERQPAEPQAAESPAVPPLEAAQGKAAARQSGDVAKDAPANSDIAAQDAKANAARLKAEPAPSAPAGGPAPDNAGQAEKQAPSKAGPAVAPAENDRFNNLSRARSYSLPRESNISPGAEQTSKPARPNQPAAEPAKALSQQQAPVTQLQRDGAEAGSNRLRALFVLQLADPPAAAASVQPADAASPEAKPAEPAEPAAKKP